MTVRRFAPQPSLFDPPQQAGNIAGSLIDDDEPPDEDFIQTVRDDLGKLLALAGHADTFPWSDLTRTYMEEMRFYSMSRWLPSEEAAQLRDAFGIAMDRLYELADQERPEVWGRDGRFAR